MVLKDKMTEMMVVEELDQETIREVERIVVLRLSIKDINLWMRQLEMKRNAMSSWPGC